MYKMEKYQACRLFWVYQIHKIMAIVHKIEVTKYQVYRTSHSNLPLYRDLAFTSIYIA